MFPKEADLFGVSTLTNNQNKCSNWYNWFYLDPQRHPRMFEFCSLGCVCTILCMNRII